MNICDLQKYILMISKLQKMMVLSAGALGRCLSHKDGTLMNGISALWKKLHKLSPACDHASTPILCFTSLQNSEKQIPIIYMLLSLGISIKQIETKSWFFETNKIGKPLARLGFPLWLRILLQWRKPGFDPWAGKIPWRGKRLPTPVFWAGKFHGLH